MKVDLITIYIPEYNSVAPDGQCIFPHRVYTAPDTADCSFKSSPGKRVQSEAVERMEQKSPHRADAIRWRDAIFRFFKVHKRVPECEFRKLCEPGVLRCFAAVKCWQILHQGQLYSTLVESKKSRTSVSEITIATLALPFGISTSIDFGVMDLK
jgi:hypothetical protein